MANETRRPPHVFAKPVLGGRTWYVKRGSGLSRRRESTGIKVDGDGLAGNGLWDAQPEALKRKIAQAVKEIEQGWDQDAGQKAKTIPTIRGYWDDIYLPTHSHEGDGVRMAAVLDRWGRMKLTDITKSHCVKLLNDQGEKYEPGTVNRRRGLWQAFFSRAVEDGLLAANPFKAVKNALPGAINERTISSEEQEKLLRVLTPELGRWLIFMLGTGLRLAEARAVLPAHLDRARRTLQVQGKAKDGSHIAKYGKSREVTLFPRVEVVVDQQWGAEGKLWPYVPSWYRYVCEKAAERAGIEHFSPHALRHTYGSRFITNGGSMTVLSKLMGHASTAFTEKQYVHLKVSNVVAMSVGIEMGL